MNNIIRFAPATLTLAIFQRYTRAHAAEETLTDGETMVVQATAEEALKQQPGFPSSRQGHRKGSTG